MLVHHGLFGTLSRMIQICFEGEGGGSAAALGGGGAPPASGTPPAGTPPPSDQPWYSTIENNDVKTLMQTKAYDSPMKVAEAYYNLNLLQNNNASVVGIPAKDDDTAGWDKTWKALGRPDKAEDYQFTFEKDVKVDPRMQTFAKSLFHKLGASPARAQAGANEWNNFVKQVVAEDAAEAEKKNTEAIDALKAKWGANWDTHVASGQQAVRALGLEDAILDKLDGYMGMSAVMQLMAVIGQKLGRESTIIDPPGGGNPGFQDMTKEMAGSEIKRLMGDAEFQKKMTTIGHPERDTCVNRWLQLHEIRDKK